MLQDAQVLAIIRRKLEGLATDLDERGRRRFAALEASSLGRGGNSAVACATGLSRTTIRSGLRELAMPEPLTATRQRRPGGGA